MRLLLAALLLSGCQFVRVRYHGGAEKSAALACFPAEEEPERLECFPYLETKVKVRGQSQSI